MSSVNGYEMTCNPIDFAMSSIRTGKELIFRDCNIPVTQSLISFLVEAM